MTKVNILFAVIKNVITVIKIIVTLLLLWS